MNARVVSALLVMVVLLVIAVTSFAVSSYASGLLGGVMEFAGTSDFARLAECGVTVPPALQGVQQDFATVILPAVYAGVPLLLIIISLLMFLAGVYYQKGSSAKAERPKATPPAGKENQ
ncbi:MAG: hypothetical protein AB1626_02050 [Candidatus Micrarchaeota archaeon]